MKAIFAYTDFRKYLRDKYKYLKETTDHFSHRYFCKKAGFSSSATLKLVMDGKRNLSPSGVEKFIEGLGLKNLEAKYFWHLVFFTQEKRALPKERHWAKMREITGEEVETITLTLAIDPQKMEEAKKEIEAFLNRMQDYQKS